MRSMTAAGRVNDKFVTPGGRSACSLTDSRISCTARTQTVQPHPPGSAFPGEPAACAQWQLHALVRLPARDVSGQPKPDAANIDGLAVSEAAASINDKPIDVSVHHNVVAIELNVVASLGIEPDAAVRRNPLWG